MRPLIFDVETTSKNDGHPYDSDNRLLFWGDFNGYSRNIADIEFSSKPYGDKLSEIQQRIDDAPLIVAFNAKFDIAWGRRYGLKFSHKKLLDLQAAEFILSGQSMRMPSLDGCLARRGLPLKKPFDFEVEHSESEWREYLGQDLSTEYLLFEAVAKDLEANPKLRRLVFDDSQDILITQEMEWNGIYYDLDKSLGVGAELSSKVKEIDAKLYSMVPCDYINWNSGEHISAILYGGLVKFDTRESYEKTLKSGQVKQVERKVSKTEEFPRLVEPLPNSELKKRGYYQTGEGILKTLKASGLARQIITLILERAKLEKRIGTYYYGIPELYKKMGWSNNLIHGQLHHCVARTGRLSSSKPNQQNIEDAVRACIVTRFQ